MTFRPTRTLLAAGALSVSGAAVAILSTPLKSTFSDHGVPPDIFAQVPASAGHAQSLARRAILVSIDALNEEIARRTLSERATPTLFRILDDGVCAVAATTSFPSSTAPAHAALWTGAYSDVNGVAGNLLHRLPATDHTVLEVSRGFAYAALGAEPIWIAAGRVGIPVVGHHPTHSPGIPGYRNPQELGPDADSTRMARRSVAARALARSDVNVVNGYNRPLEPHRILDSDAVEWVEDDPWSGLDELGLGVPPRGFQWETAVGVLRGLLHGRDRYEAITVARSPDVRSGVTVWAGPAESEGIGNRELARHFSAPLEIEVEGGRVYLHLRLFDVEEDGSDFLLYYPGFEVVEGNRSDLARDYDRAVGGWVGSDAALLYGNGRFGRLLTEGGDGTAEARYVETAELVTRQFMRGSDWLWGAKDPWLMLDYFPLGDQVDHALLGPLAPEWPGFDPAVAERISEFRARVWSLVDLRLERLLELALAADGALFLTGDHGMRASWKVFRPNVALREVGLLSLDEAGAIDLSRTRAASPNGVWITVNRSEWEGGIVPPSEEASILAAARRVIEGTRDGSGEPVVTETFTPNDDPQLGIGGPAGGDLYWETAPGYRSSAAHTPPEAAGPARVTAGHGFSRAAPDMQTVFCGIGAGLATDRRVPQVMTSSIAPTVAAYTGIPEPADARGSSVLELLLLEPR